MRKKGFTLVELLAVIVVLGIIMTIAGTAVLGQRKKANIEEAKKIEQTLADLGPGIYAYENTFGSSDENSFKSLYKSENDFIIQLDELKKGGYIDKIDNPFGGEDCNAYLLVNPNANASEDMFKGYLNCGDQNYKTDGYDDHDESTTAILTQTTQN